MTGLVQGVGFRPHVWRLATAFGLGGWVLNSPSGVTIEVQGPLTAVEGFARELVQSPPRQARIAGFEVSDVVPQTAAAVTAVVTAAPAGGVDHPSGSGEASGGGAPAGGGGFVILASRDEGDRKTLVSPDIAICDACRRELENPADRRFGYPFTNCTDCGPRYTIIRGLPYDRPLTSMHVFPMCPECREEYEDPGDRRFHAQPNACPACGPGVWLEKAGETRSQQSHSGRWPEAFRDLIRSGAIVAVKGLGGFHLACDATSEAVVARLRERKRRPRKPFAVMAPDLDTARRYARVGPQAERLLLSPAAPIVIVPLRSSAGEYGSAPACSDAPGGPAFGEPGATAPSLAPGSPTLGLMLAYTPLHLLLFDPPAHAAGSEGPGGSRPDGPRIELLVMTSANASDMPIIKDNDEARRQLAGIADYLLLHDREIVNRCEDSVYRVDERDPAHGAEGGGAGHHRRCLRGVPAAGLAVSPGDDAHAWVVPFRRSRGYVPAPVDVPASLPTGCPVTLGAGGEMKNVFCLTRGGQAFLSPHLGEMGSVESLESFRETYARYLTLLDVAPDLVAYDPHPEYLSSRLALTIAAEHGATAVPVYHHHAHLVSCLADNDQSGEGEVLGLICDGTGFGPDGTIWGGEVLAGNALGFRRLGHLAPVRLPGGDVAARHTFRSAAAHLHRILGPSGLERLARLYPREREELDVCRASLAERAARLPVTTSAGRLFDAVAAMLGLTAQNTYEGEAAVALSDRAEMADRAPGLGDRAWLGDRAPSFAVRAEEPIIIDPAPFLTALLEALETEGPEASDWALAFHQALASAAAEALHLARQRTGLSRVALSGGTFQNVWLLRHLVPRLRRDGFEVLTHRRVPPGDGGLALGQAVIAAWQSVAASSRPDRVTRQVDADSTRDT